jgi:glycosyltransferase involved in cell wall biosynthesis
LFLAQDHQSATDNHARSLHTTMTTNEPEVTIVIPCLNEAETIGTVIDKAQEMLRASGVAGEIIVADNGSSDGSARIAVAFGARLIHVAALGYGNALRGGIDAARGCFIIMCDADDSYDFSDLMKFIDQLRDGYDLVVGNRFRGGIEPTAMPVLHRYFGVPILNLLGRVLHGFPPCRDFHCGLRGVNRAAAEKMNLRATGMEFASEMIVKAAANRMRITEIPTTLSPAGRKRRSHLRTWTDGWRHLSLLLRETGVGSAILNKNTL